VLSGQRGMTLVELMVTISVLAILVALAAPSFREFRERQALKGAVDNYVVALAEAKQEAIKRDQWVRVDFHGMGSGVCLGAVLVDSEDASAADGCDCSESTCEIARFPESEADLKGVELDGAVDFAGDTGFVIDPKTGALADIGDTGALLFKTPKGYALRLTVNAMARPSLCVPASADRKLPGVVVCE